MSQLLDEETGVEALSFTEKIDVLEMIIQVLNDHEKKLDALIERVEAVADRLDKVMEYAKRDTEVD